MAELNKMSWKEKREFYAKRRRTKVPVHHKKLLEKKISLGFNADSTLEVGANICKHGKYDYRRKV